VKFVYEYSCWGVSNRRLAFWKARIRLTSFEVLAWRQWMLQKTPLWSTRSQHVQPLRMQKRNFLILANDDFSFYPSQVKRGKSLELLYGDLFKNAWRPICIQSSEARGMKIGMHNHYIDGLKVTGQFFDILPRSRDI